MSKQEIEDRLRVASEKPSVAASPNQKAWRRFRQNRPAAVSAWFLVALVLVVITWPVILKCPGVAGSLHDPDTLSNDTFQPPGIRHWCGTDAHGRDLFSRILYGAQISLMVGAVGAGVSLIIGVCWGAV